MFHKCKKHQRKIDNISYWAVHTPIKMLRSWMTKIEIYCFCMNWICFFWKIICSTGCCRKTPSKGCHLRKSKLTDNVHSLTPSPLPTCIYGQEVGTFPKSEEPNLKSGKRVPGSRKVYLGPQKGIWLPTGYSIPKRVPESQKWLWVHKKGPGSLTYLPYGCPESPNGTWVLKKKPGSQIGPFLYAFPIWWHPY